MSSEVITKNDLKNIFDEILPLPLIGVDGAVIKADGASLPIGSSSAAFNPTSSVILGGDTFSAGTNNRIVVNKACICIVVTYFACNTIGSESALKVFGLGKNSTNDEIAATAVGYPKTWDSRSSVDVVGFDAGDTLHFTGRSNSGAATIVHGNVAIIRLGKTMPNYTTAPTVTVVETGTNNNWQYRKWSDGTYEAWQYYQATGMTISTSSGGTYYGGNKTLSFPSFHTNWLQGYATNNPSQGSGIYVYQVSANNGFRIDYRAHASQTNASCGASLYLRGRWIEES